MKKTLTLHRCSTIADVNYGFADSEDVWGFQTDSPAEGFQGKLHHRCLKLLLQMPRCQLNNPAQVKSFTMSNVLTRLISWWVDGPFDDFPL